MPTNQQTNQDPTLAENLQTSQETPPEPPTQPETPPTNNEPAQPQGTVYTQDQVQTIHSLYGQTLRENEQRLQQLQRELDEAKARTQQQPQSNEPEDILTDGRRIIGEEIGKRLEPFSNWMQQQQAQTVYQQLKETFKKHPNFSAFFNIPNAEMYLDQMLANNPQVNVNVVGQAIAQIYGWMQLNGLVNSNPQTPTVNNTPVQSQPAITNTNQPTQQSPNNMVSPPHLRPSAPPSPRGGGNNLTPKGNVRRQLTELEMRVARENRMSADEYIDFLNEDATKVAFSDIGKPQENK